MTLRKEVNPSVDFKKGIIMDTVKNIDYKKTDLLACDCCGWIERAPFVDGDTCICGGTFRPYHGKTELRGSIEFVAEDEFEQFFEVSMSKIKKIILGVIALLITFFKCVFLPPGR